MAAALITYSVDDVGSTTVDAAFIAIIVHCESVGMILEVDLE